MKTLQQIHSLYRIHPICKKEIWGQERWLLFSRNTEFLGSFPLLLKLIEAEQALSVQVHPTKEYALSHPYCTEKNEFWHVLNAKPNSYVYCGLKKTTTRNEIIQAVKNNTVTQLLHKVIVKNGDSLFIPAGTIHAIGPGIQIFEAQQNSNSTFRLYDYGRLDHNKESRTLHIKDALGAAALNCAPPNILPASMLWKGPGLSSKTLICSKYFTVKKFFVSQSAMLSTQEHPFLSLFFLKGSCNLVCGADSIRVHAGDSIVLKGNQESLFVNGTCQFIMTHI